MSRVFVGERTFMLSREKGKERSPSLKMGFSIFFFCLVLFSLLWADAYVRSLTRSCQYQISAEAKKIQRLEQEKMELLSRVAELKNPRRISRIAVTRLGLKEPDSENIVREKWY